MGCNFTHKIVFDAGFYISRLLNGELITPDLLSSLTNHVELRVVLPQEHAEISLRTGFYLSLNNSHHHSCWSDEN